MIQLGNCLDVMLAINADSVDAIVTDPPYGLEFMGKGWDHGVPGIPFWAAALAIVKPGAHLVAFGGTRTFHRLTCAIEDAGWEIRDCLCWLYGSGFPKSLDVSKAIDKAAGVADSRTFKSSNPADRPYTHTVGETSTGWKSPVRPDKTNPYSEEAEEWDGWGTALKPAWEPIILARKPLVGTVAANVQRYGTGALNVDACRIAGPNWNGVWGSSNATVGGDRTFNASPEGEAYRSEQHPAGRWPANVLLDEEAAAQLDAQSGERPGQLARARTDGVEQGNTVLGPLKHITKNPEPRADTGGASRFFYCAKASRAEREVGLDGLPVVHATSRPASDDVEERTIQERLHGRLARNHHPTVKPVALMRWLVRLVTPPGGLVLDPFAGSGTTGIACELERRRFHGIEREAEYVAIATARLAAAVATPELFVADGEADPRQEELFG